MKRMITLILVCVMSLSLCACGGEPAPKVDLKQLYETCTGLMTEMMPVEGTTRLDFMGIPEEDCAQVYTAFAQDGMLTDEIWLIEAKDQQALERLQKLAQSRMDAKAAETISYSPEQYAVVEKGEILTEGLYLALLVSPNVEQLKQQFTAAFQ